MKKVFINGCFDILHRGHIEMFKYGCSLGEKLVVAIDSDERVKKLKGSDRPFNCLEDRMFVLSSIKYIDEVLSFYSDEELVRAIKEIGPNIMIVGGDWKGKPVIGSEYALEVKYFDRIKKYSTTKILQRLVDR